MTDIFDQRAVADSGAGEYGASGDMKKTQYLLQLLGMAYCADTLKCILAPNIKNSTTIIKSRGFLSLECMLGIISYLYPKLLSHPLQKKSVTC